MKTTHNIFMKIIFILTLCMGWGSTAITMGAYAQEAEPTERGLTFVSSSDTSTSGEWPAMLLDGNSNTKWGNSWSAGTPQWVIAKSSEPVVAKKYKLVNAGDTHKSDYQQYKRQWKSWKVEGSTNGSDWVELDLHTDDVLPHDTPSQIHEFELSNTQAYIYYRVTVSAIDGGTMHQMADFILYALDATSIERAEAMASVTQQIGDANDATWTAFVEARTTFAGDKTETNAQAVLTAYTNWKSSTTTNLYLPDGYYYMKGMDTGRYPYLYADYPTYTNGYTHHSGSYTLTNKYLWKVERVGDTGIRMVNGQGVPLWTDGNTRYPELTFGARNGMEGIYFTQAINLRNDRDTGTLTTWASGGNSKADNRWTFLTPEMGGKEIYTVRLVNAPANTYITYDGQYAMDGGFFLASTTPTEGSITAADIDDTHKVLSRSIDTDNKTITIRYGAAGQVYMTYNVYHGSVTPANLLFTMECAETPGSTPTFGGYVFPTYLDVANKPNEVPSESSTYNLVTTYNATAPFRPDGTTVYSLKIKDANGYVKSNLGYSSAPNANTPNTYEYGWKITGDWYHGFYFQNADTDMFLNPGTNNNVTQIALVADKADAKPLELVAANNTSFWALRTKGTSNCYLNKRTNLGTYSNADAGCHLTFTALTDLHYLATYTYMWNGGVVHEEDNLRKQRGDAFGATIPAGYTSSGNPTVDGDVVTSVHGVGPYEFQLRKNTRVVNGIEAEISVGVTHEIDNIFPGLKVVDFEGHDLVAGGYNLTVGDAGECVSIDGSTITGTARSTGTHRLGVELTSEASALYNAPTTGFPSVRVFQGLARVRFKEELKLIILDYGTVDGAVNTVPLSKESFIFEPTAAKESFTLTDLHVVTKDNDTRDTYRASTTGGYNLNSYAVTTEDLIVQPTLTSNNYDIEVPPTAKLRVYDLEKYTQLTNTLHDIHSYKIGDQLGEYSYTGTTPNDETGNAGYESYWSDLYRQGSNLHGIHKVEEEEGINAKIAELHAKVTSFQTNVQNNTSLNMPEAGKTLLTINNGTDIYYYDEAKGLLAYTQAAAANSESVAHGQYRSGTGITFAGVPNANRAVKGQYKMSTTGETLYELNSVPSLPYTISASGNGYGTLYAPVALKIPAGVKAYVEIKEEAPEAGIAKIKLAPLASIIPAQTAVILKGVAGQTYNFSVTTSIYEAQNIFFAGTYPTQTISGSYTLQPNGAGVGFYTWSGDVTGFRAYIPDKAPDSGRVRAYVLDFGDGTETGIETILGTTSPATPAYDLSGRLVQPTQRGLYLQQGRKVLRK